MAGQLAGRLGTGWTQTLHQALIFVMAALFQRRYSGL
jgi:hypothetical protein